MTNGAFLILLVGSNPLPNYLAACALRPDRVGLVYTNETRPVKERLRNALVCALSENIVPPDDNKGFVEDATSATTVRRVFDSLMPPRNERGDAGQVWLNYTGGNKVMAAHSLQAYSMNGGRPKHASYLDEGGPGREPRLRFDDGTSRPLSDCPDIPLNLKTVLALHGIEHKPRAPRHPAPTVDDAREILCKVLEDVSVAKELYCERKRLEAKEFRNPSKATSVPFEAARYGLRLSVPSFPTSEHLQGLKNGRERESWFEQWYKFIGGEWLEEWLGAQINGLTLTPRPEITVGVNAFRGQKKAQLEVDIAVIRGHRSYFISCTTAPNKDLCKLKLFEVAVRSRQLGGDLARAALVCLLDDKTIQALQQDVEEVWGKETTTKVFGLSDVRAWSDCFGQQPNLYSRSCPAKWCKFGIPS